MAKKLAITSDLHTATSANHPDSPDQSTARTMSGRSYAAVKPTAGHSKGRVGGGSLPTRNLGGKKVKGY